MASRLRSFFPPRRRGIPPLRCGTERRSLPSRSLAPAPRASSVGRLLGLARSLQPLHSAVSEARLTSRLGAEVARAVSQETGLSVPR
ncbi:hypothetical protein GUJ93_ZPchr0002g23711 [Zizania palustris]|uniref:Uncharacterized protein n=1 Tax=Zizania palustris TaxID=103762 RepID=A0A8J5RFN5_ZIZPA|nr:hypothetical protein GUJ93_ZPchr0002g23711 [Zizania palustris]